MKILVVEDEHRIAHYIKKGLEMKSYVVDVAYDGEAGLDLAMADDYDLIVLDRMLPKLDGVEFCAQLRAVKNHVLILMLTAKNEIDERVEGLDAGADDYLGKPFAFTELLARIRALARRPQQQIETKLQVADLVLNTINYQVLRSGQEIKLSKQEFALLEFFMRHRGQVFSKEQLAEKVWSYDSDILSNTTQVYIGYLRKKIDRPFPKKNKLIQTVRGFGYKLGDNKKI